MVGQRPLHAKRRGSERALWRREIASRNLDLRLALILDGDVGLGTDRSYRVAFAVPQAAAAKLERDRWCADGSRHRSGRAELPINAWIDLLQLRRVERQVEMVAGLAEGTPGLERVAGNAQSHVDIAHAHRRSKQMSISCQRQTAQATAFIDFEAYVGRPLGIDGTGSCDFSVDGRRREFAERSRVEMCGAGVERERHRAAQREAAASRQGPATRFRTKLAKVDLAFAMHQFEPEAQVFFAQKRLGIYHLAFNLRTHGAGETRRAHRTMDRAQVHS